MAEHTTGLSFPTINSTEHFYLDGWYAHREVAEAVAGNFRQEPHIRCAFVIAIQAGSYGVLYAGPEPLADWHGDPTDWSWGWLAEA